MRERKLVLDGSPCDMNLYSGGPKTVAEAKRIEPSVCPYYEKRCKRELSGHGGLDCIMLRALQVAQSALKEGHSVDEEMKDFGEFFKSYTIAKGFVYSADRKEFQIITDRQEILQKICEFAKIILDEDQKHEDSEPKVGDSFEDVLAYATTKEGAIDLKKLDELEGRFGTNGGKGCDVRSGPCSCGTRH